MTELEAIDTQLRAEWQQREDKQVLIGRLEFEVEEHTLAIDHLLAERVEAVGDIDQTDQMT